MENLAERYKVYCEAGHQEPKRNAKRMVYFLAGLALFIIFFLSWRSLVSTNSNVLARNLRLAGGALGIIAGGLLTFVTRSPLGLPLLLFSFALLKRAGSRPSPTEQRSSGVTTAWLSIFLDHQTGATDGDVLRGRFQGRKLASLSVKELASLVNECGNDDPKSAQLVTAYLDRIHPDWREQAANNRPPSSDKGMRIEEAYEILGLAPGATREAIMKAHKELMRRNHPDRGGSSWLAARINEARDLLLG